MITAECFTVFSGKCLNKYVNVPVMIYVIGTGTSINFLITLFFSSSFENIYLIGEVQIYALLMLVILGGVLMMYCWGKAFQLISLTQAPISLEFNTLSTILLSSFMLNEEITLKLIVGFLSIIFAITLANWRIKK